MREHGRNDARIDQATAHIVDAGLRICSQHGVNSALQFLDLAGVPRPVALRVLCSPDHFRTRERRKFRRPGRQAGYHTPAESASAETHM